ncbi:MAG TPA: PIG-L family deacetylase [Planctomycetota bacterium]|nr:PIG-L family deacetylase [Planctomycetota bacterium]
MPRFCTEHVRRFSLIAVFLLVALRAAEEPPFEHSAEFIRNEVRIAATGIRALAVAAHPDDEDGATLSFLRREGCETHICFFTRGEGGQNEAGPEVGVQLAALRTREIDAACAILGAKPWFLNLPDFGFSKSVEETMQKWNHDVALERMVRIIRRVRPQIVITNHDPDGTDHAHHRAAAKILVEAFDAAADSQKFPQQLKDEGLKPWEISRIYLRHFTAQGATITVDLSKRDAFSGLTPSEVGAFALSKHASQGMLRDLKAGERELRHFSILKSRADDSSVSALIDKSIKDQSAGNMPLLLSGIAETITGNDLLTGKVAERIAWFISSQPDLPEDKRTHLNRALAEALGLKLEVRAEDGYVTAGEKAKISLRVANTGAMAVWLGKFSFKAESPKWSLVESKSEKTLNSGDAENAELEISAADGAPLSWPVEEHLFAREESRTPVTAVAELWLQLGDGKTATFYMNAPVPLGLAAPYTFSLSPDPLLIFGDPDMADKDADGVHFKLLATCNRRIAEPVQLAASYGTKPKQDDPGRAISLRSKGDTEAWSFNTTREIGALNAGLRLPTFIWDAQQYYAAPTLSVQRVPLGIPSHLRVALIKGTDDQTLLALKRIENCGLAMGGFAVETPTDNDLRTMNLNRYQAIVLDIRSTQQRPEIRKMKDRLADFMNDGGTVVCLYQKDFDWNAAGQPVRGAGFFRGVGGGGEIAPFPIELSFNRITDENAPVKILKPDHPLLLKPCRIWPKDFEGWVQERGAYFPQKWAPEYTPLLSSNDPNEAPLDGGLLVADVGRGAFVYTSYFWHHQLRAGVPGAYRMMVNMVCYSRMKREDKK